MGKSFEQVCVVGLGYIGLPTAALIAESGARVVGVDVNENVRQSVNSGECHIEEPGLAGLVSKLVNEKTLIASKDPVESDVFVVAVPTPMKMDSESKPQPDVSFVEAAIKSLSHVLKRHDLIIIESTCPVGTTERMCSLLRSLRPELFPTKSTMLFSMAFCPERILPGRALQEMVSNDRVIGGITRECSEKARQFYSTFVSGKCSLASSSHVAELAKLTENSYRDLNIAFANELSMICEEVGIDVWELIELANRHPRVSILEPGPGVGGHCIAVDPWFIVSQVPALARLIKTARLVNESKPSWVVEKVKEIAEKHLELPIICCGLTFKPDVDDFRESPSLRIYYELDSLFPGRVAAADPYIEKLDILPSRIVEVDAIEDMAGIMVLLVNHSRFSSLRPRSRLVVDTKGVWRDL